MVNLSLETEQIKSGIEVLLRDSNEKEDQRVLLSMFTAVRNLEVACDEQYKQAYVDALTQIPNRRAVDEKLNEFIKDANSTGINFTYMNLDIKDFKRFNDLYDESVGDEKLKDIASLLKNEIRDSDFVGRHGGDEYTILLKNVGVKESLAKANEIKKKALQIYDIDLHIGIANYKESTGFEGQIKAHSAFARELSKSKGVPMIYESKCKEKKVVPFLSSVINYFTRQKDALTQAKKAYNISLRNSELQPDKIGMQEGSLRYNSNLSEKNPSYNVTSI